MKKKEIEQLLKVQANPCITIVVPAHHTSPDRIADKDVLSNAIKQAKELLAKKTEPAIAEQLSAQIDKIASQIDFLHASSGIGIYISPEVSKTISFSMPVTRKVLVGNSFDSRDLLFELSGLLDYVVLLVSRNKINLYKGEGETFHQIHNDDFPLNYKETYEYAKTSPGTSFSESTLKSYEKDKSFLLEVRMRDFMRHADMLAAKYINESLPLIIAGDAKDAADFKSITKHAKLIAGAVNGNYLNDEKQLALLSRNVLVEKIKKENAELVTSAKELIGNRLIAVGVEESKRAADEGMGLKLLVEKDLVYNDGTGSTANAYHLVDEVIKSVREKDGDVVVMENGDLKDFKGMALLLRYNSW